MNTDFAGLNTEIVRLVSEYPELRVKIGRKFAYRPPATIMVPEAANKDFTGEDRLRLLHEMGHFLCEHRNYRTEIERIRMEREAWEKARELARELEVAYDEDLVEAELDSYRDWIYQKAKCPRCGQARMQDGDGKYICPACEMES